MELHNSGVRATGLRTVAVGLGKAEHAGQHCGTLAPSITCLCTEKPDVHRLFGLERGRAAQLLDPKLWTASVRAALRGHLQGKATGDVAMLGGTFVVDRQGVIRYARYNVHAGDNPDFAALLAEIRTARARVS